jgi:tetratricopeptide (TPR) repeat protein
MFDRVPRALPTFVGRQPELERALALLGEDTLCMISGLPGVGKTELGYRLMIELSRLERWADARVVRVVVEPGDDLAAVTQRWAAALELETSPSESIAVALAAALDAGPTIAFVDDADHLAAGEAANLFGAVARELRRSVLLVASRRRLPAPAVLPSAIQIRLGPLAEPETAELVGLLVERRGLAAVDACEVHRRSGGIPELIQLTVGATDDPCAASGLAGSLVELPPLARRLLLISSLLAVPVDREALLAAVPDQDASAALAELVERDLVGFGPAGVIAPPVVRDTLTRVADEQEEAAARRAVAELHEQRFRADPHRAGDALAAVHELRTAGDPGAAWRLLSESFEAAPEVGRAPGLLDEVEALERANPTARAEVEMLRARVFLRQGDPAAAASALDRAPALERVPTAASLTLRGLTALLEGRLDDAEELLETAAGVADDERERFRATLHLAEVVALRGEGELARQRLDQARRARGELADHERVHFELSRSLTFFTEERLEEAFARPVEANLLALGGGDDYGLGLLVGGLLCCVAVDDVPSARALLGRLESAVGDRALAGPALALLRGIVMHAEGALSEARAALEAAVCGLASTRAELFVPIAHEHLAGALLGLGEIDAAAASLSRGIEVAERIGMARMAARARALLGEVMVAQGGLDRARRELEAAIDDPRAAGRDTRHLAVRGLAYISALEGDLRRGRELLASLAEAPGASPGHEASLALASAELELLGGRVERVLEDGLTAVRYYQRTGRDWLAARAGVALAAGYAVRGGDADLVDASLQLDRVAEIVAERGYRGLAISCGLVRAALHRRHGDQEQSDQIIVDSLRAAAVGDRRRILVQALRGVIDQHGREPLLAGLASLLSMLGLIGEPSLAVVDRHGTRLLSPAGLSREVARRGLVVDLTSHTLTGHGARGPRRTRPTVCRLLARLVVAGEQGLDDERLFCDVWNADHYDQRRSRNTLHVTLNRVRSALADLLPGRTVVETLAHGWRIAPDIDACVITTPTRARELPGAPTSP